MSALIRDAVDRVIPADDVEERWRRALKAVAEAVPGGGVNVSEDHDRYLADAIEDWREK
jgi:pimeloyl-ACP methyl ester carboxylesterase